MSERNVGTGTHEASMQSPDVKERNKGPEGKIRSAAESIIMARLQYEGNQIDNDRFNEMLENNEHGLKKQVRDLHLQIKAIYKKANENNLTGDARRKFIADEARTVAEEFFKGEKLMGEHEKGTANPKIAENEARYPSTKEIKELNNTPPVKRNILMRAYDNVMGYVGVKQAAAIDFLARRRGKLEAKAVRQPGETQEAYEKRMRLRGLTTTFGAIALGGAFAAYKLYTNADTGNTLDTSQAVVGGGSGAGDLLQGDSPDSYLNLTPEAQAEPQVYVQAGAGGGERMWMGTMFDGYNPLEDPFNFPGKDKAVDFMPPLVGENAAEKGQQMMDNYTKSPIALAAKVEALGFTPEGMSPAELTEKLENDGYFAKDMFDKVQAAKQGDSWLHGHLQKGDTYASFFGETNEVDGTIELAFDSYVTESKGSEIIATSFKNSNGEIVTLLDRAECGQPIELFEGVPAPQGGGEVVVNTPAPQGGAEVVVNTPAPQGGGEMPPPPSGGGELPPPSPPSGGGELPPPPSGGGELPPPPPPSGGGELPPPPSDVKNYDLVPNQEGWDQQAAGDLTEDPAKVGNGTASPDMTAEQQPGQAIDAAQNVTTDTTQGEAASTIGTGSGRTAETGDNGVAAAVADATQSHESAVGQATDAVEGTDAATTENPGESTEITL